MKKRTWDLEEIYRRIPGAAKEQRCGGSIHCTVELGFLREYSKNLRSNLTHSWRLVPSLLKAVMAVSLSRIAAPPG